MKFVPETEVMPTLFYMVRVDIIGILKLTSLGNKYILSIVAYYIKYAEAETVVLVLEHAFSFTYRSGPEF